MLTCVAVALNIPPFTSSKKIDASSVASTGGLVEQRLNGPTAIPASLVVANGSEPSLETRFEPAVAVAESNSSVDHNSQEINHSNASNTAPISRISVNGSLNSDTSNADPTNTPERPTASSSVEEIPTTALNLVPPNTDSYEVMATDTNEVITTFVGVWAPDAGTCSARDFRNGLLPAVLSADGAWAGETFCMFTNKTQTQTGWNVVAKCSSPTERWTANVRLTVKNDRLTWTSKRGTQSYSRCAPDVRTAAAR
jgi:hypothetical protein